MHAVADKAKIEEGGIKRSDMLAIDKMIAEGAAEEEKICLRWIMNTRALQVKLPHHKAVGWASQIDLVLQSKSVSSKSLESVLGRLENVAQVLTPLGHFLCNIRQLQILADRKGYNVKLNTRVRNDLTLAKGFLRKVQSGVSLNLLTFRIPGIVYICDASEYGLGGFTSHGRAWSYTIPPKLRNRAHINILEYLAQIISIWIDIIENTTKPEDFLLSIGDNTSSLGWMRRSNFRQKDESDKSWEVKQMHGRLSVHPFFTCRIPPRNSIEIPSNFERCILFFKFCFLNLCSTVPVRYRTVITTQIQNLFYVRYRTILVRK